ncbi:MAG: hypothetical protein LBS59_02850 [Puniceicoccales bacterium]|jgi:hypothetical protein|nr:hypothetical protein [Puniceicoccales bacterium]
MKKILPAATFLAAALVCAPVSAAPDTIATTGFTLAYGPSSATPIPLDELRQLKIFLVRKNGVWFTAGTPSSDFTPIQSFTLGETFSDNSRFAPETLLYIFNTIVKHFNKRGVHGVYVVVDSEDINPQTHEDYRPADRRTLRLVVWTSRVGTLRTVARGSRLEKAETINNPVHAAIAENSPLQPPAVAPQSPEATPADTHSDTKPSPGSLFSKPLMDDYLLRLNRHPARRVDAAISSGSAPGEITLDYLISERRSWFAYAQISNTGTESTSRYREHIGTSAYQLTNYDDLLQLDFGSASIEHGNSASASYDRPLIFPDYLRIRPFGSYGDFTARDTASHGLNEFKGSSAVGGIELAWSPFRLGEISIDFVPGISWQYYHVNNSTMSLTGNVQLLVPMFSLRATRNTDTMRTSLNVSYETNLHSVFDVSENDIRALGHLTANLSYNIVRYEFRHSMFLEPLIHGEKFWVGDEWGKMTRAHQIVFSVRGQKTINNNPLVPQKRMTLGGLHTVRGYPESLVSGDNAIVGTAEYRLHLPRLFRPYKTNNGKNKTVPDSAPPTYFGIPFNWRAPSASSVPDWDLSLCFFVDAGHTEVNEEPTPWSRNQTFTGLGVGLELQIGSFLNARVDWGIAQDSVSTGNQKIHRGDSEVHFSAAFLW